MSDSLATAQSVRQLRKSVVDSLPALAGNQFPSAKIGRMFNVLLNSAREESPENPMLATFEPLKEEGTSCGVDAPTLIAMLDQILVALDGRSEGPAVSSPTPLTDDLRRKEW